MPPDLQGNLLKLLSSAGALHGVHWAPVRLPVRAPSWSLIRQPRHEGVPANVEQLLLHGARCALDRPILWPRHEGVALCVGGLHRSTSCHERIPSKIGPPAFLLLCACHEGVHGHVVLRACIHNLLCDTLSLPVLLDLLFGELVSTSLLQFCVCPELPILRIAPLFLRPTAGEHDHRVAPQSGGSCLSRSTQGNSEYVFG
mmetsp:Transcript_16170/g.37880  ORF Transcript_16170/g.37880 Transcript_16170/m.37880 type:complete len:200 (+) Transcript_16170:1082-1681(+)